MQNGNLKGWATRQGFDSNGLQGMYEKILPLQKDLVDHGSGSAFDLANTYAELGRKPEAFAALQIAFDRHDSSLLVNNPIAVADDPAYKKLRAQVDKLRVQ